MWRRGLYAITDPTLTPPPRMPDEVRAALAGGAVMIQYRDKHSGPIERRALAGELLRLCREAQVPLIINDDVTLAAVLGADGVHLGRDDSGIEEARALLGPRALIGVSCYNEFARAEAAAGAGADYIAFGRFFPSRTKPDARQADAALLRRARRALSIPIAAIGGIDATNGADLIAAGADLLAVIDGVFGRGDTRVAAANISALWDSRPTPRRRRAIECSNHIDGRRDAV